MRLDVDLVRKILLRVEEIHPDELGRAFGLEGLDQSVVNEHVMMLIREWYLEGKSFGAEQANAPLIVTVERLTPKGYELAERARDEVAWEQAKRSLQESGASVSLDTIVAALKRRGEKLMLREPDTRTGLLTLETFNGDLAGMVKGSLSAGEPLSAVFVDIDHFKKVNDSNGHEAGNVVLMGVAAALLSVVRGKGQAYRYGGEEMVLLLPNHTVEEATATAERARIAIAGAPIHGLTITVSLGVATLPEHAQDGDSLIKAADAAMYDAKARNRNLVRIHGEKDPPTPEARQITRRMPEPGGVSEEQLQAIREAYFDRDLVCCPKCIKVIDVRERHDANRLTTSLLVHCKFCGFNALIHGAN